MTIRNLPPNTDRRHGYRFAFGDVRAEWIPRIRGMGLHDTRIAMTEDVLSIAVWITAGRRAEWQFNRRLDPDLLDDNDYLPSLLNEAYADLVHYLRNRP